jgi:hypothetical protein
MQMKNTLNDHRSMFWAYRTKKMSTYFRPLVVVTLLGAIGLFPACGSKNQVACDCINPGAPSYLYASVTDSTASFK